MKVSAIFQRLYTLPASLTPLIASSVHLESTEESCNPPVALVREMARQLDVWRSVLPRQLQWLESDTLAFPHADPTVKRPTGPFFAPDQGKIPIHHRYNLDVVAAQLRTRFYQARYMLFRPFVYKVLHFPESVIEDDRQCAALAMKSACLWPIAMAPPKDKKRLVPHHFAWTQEFVSILLLIWMTRKDAALHQICEDKVASGMLETSALLMLDWLRDLKQIDGIAEWSLQFLEPLFAK